MSDTIALFDVAIIGGGPAGQAAAVVLDQSGARIAVIDEQQRPGGQILRQPPPEFSVRNWMKSASYRGLKSQLSIFEKLSGSCWIGGHSVIGIVRESDGFSLTLSGANGVRTIRARRILIAAGCYDLPVCLPGWTLPGAMAAGGLQALVKAQGIVPGNRIVLAGTHPLMLIVAAQLVAAGATVAEVAFDQRLSVMASRVAASGLTALRHAGLLRDAMAAWATLRRGGVPVRFGRNLMEIGGRTAVERVHFRERSGHDTTVACDTVGLCYGFIPQSDLPRLVQMKVAWATPAGGWTATHDSWMRSSMDGIAVAGETTGVGGASIACDEGRIAGAGLALDLDLIPLSAAEAIRTRARKALISANRFADLLARIADPSEALSRPRQADTIMCRCEDVTMAQIDVALAQTTDPNAVKLATRCGMGLCQGRGCEHMLLRLAAARCGVAPGDLPGFTARFPARPTRVGDLIA